MLSVFDFFNIGIGPSSSHSVGPMRAAARFIGELRAAGLLERTTGVTVELFGSLALTGIGHGTDRAVLLGLEGALPQEVDPEHVVVRDAAIRNSSELNLGGERPIRFVVDEDLVFHRRQSLPLHPNGMRITARDDGDESLLAREYFSIGGGFVVTAEEAAGSESVRDDQPTIEPPYPFDSAAELLEHAESGGLSIGEVIHANELTIRSDDEIREGLLHIWSVMQACVERGLRTGGVLPGGLDVERRAPDLHRCLTEQGHDVDPLAVLDWVDLWALAVNEENAAGGRVVTAPTNGAAGIIPAVLHYFTRFRSEANDDGVVRFLLVAGGIAMLYKKNASISGAEVGCQGEVGVACSMAAAALAEVLGGTPRQAEEAAEIGMEHNLGLTCDPIKGLVQVPCIERNAMGAVKAINAARLALRGDGRHFVSLDRVIRVMRRTGADMSKKYKETSRGGLAVNYTEC